MKSWTKPAYRKQLIKLKNASDFIQKSSKVRHTVYQEAENYLITYLDLRARRFVEDKCGVYWNYLIDLVKTFVDGLVENNPVMASKYETFQCSVGWIDNTLKRRGYSGVNLHGEGGEVDPAAAEILMGDFRLELV